MNTPMKHLFLTTVMALLLVPSVWGQQLIRNYGEERAATTVMHFLKIGVGARAEGMAQAFIGVADDASSLYWNPAGLGNLDGSHASVHHLEWPADISYDYLGLTRRLNDRTTIGFALAQLATDEMAVTTEEYPDGNGRTFVFSDQLLQLTGAWRMTNQFNFGVSLKFVRESIADVRMSGFLMDLGTYYRTGWKDMTVAVALTNFGPQFRPSGTYIPTHIEDAEAAEYQDFSPPTVFRIGTSLHLLKKMDHSLLFGAQITHPVDNLESYQFGLEYSWMDVAYLRGGYKFNAGEEGLSLGAGTQMKFNGLSFSFDLSYSDFGLLGSSDRMSSQFSWADEGGLW
jgi:long-subunit fatty acid transport protein